MKSNPKQKKRLLAIDLFAGAGGMSLGLKNAGFTVIGAIENDPLAVKTYKKNHPEVFMWENDIQKVTGKEIVKKLSIEKGQLDLLAGCPPCQGFSSIRTRNGKRRPRDSRNDLIFEYLRMVRVLRPKAVMLENVPALAKNSRFRKVKAALRRMGYELGGTPQILNTADFGVPQRRRRMILVCSRIGEIKLAEKVDKQLTVRQVIGRLQRPGKSGDRLHDFPENREPRTVEMISRIPKNGGSRCDLPEEYKLDCHRNLPGGFTDVYGRMAWDKVAPTITGGCIDPSKGRFLHPAQNRAITLREAALLQSFPRRYYFSLDRGKSGVAKMIGNALPPKFIKKQALAIRKSLLTASVQQNAG